VDEGACVIGVFHDKTDQKKINGLTVAMARPEKKEAHA